jgi:hypothetical protein
MIKPGPKGDNTSPHGWTLDTLEEYLNSKLYSMEVLANERESVNKERFIVSEKAVTTAMVAQEKAIGAAMSASEKAILKAEMAADKRQDASNEIRAAMVDQQKRFSDKDQTEFRLNAVESRITENHSVVGKRLENIEATLATFGGRSLGMDRMAGAGGQIIMGLIAVGALFIAYTR